MLDRWTDYFFWPALVGAWTGVLVLAGALIFRNQFDVAIFPTAVGLSVLAAVMFLAMLFDGQSRQAINLFNSGKVERFQGRSWLKSLVATDYGDRRLIVANRISWLEMLFAICLERRDLGLLAFLTFAVSGLMIMLMLKRCPCITALRQKR